VRWRAAVTALALFAAGCTPGAVHGTGRFTPTCKPVFFGVAGSGQGPHNPPPGRLPAGVTRTDGHRYGATVALLKTKLATLAGSGLAAAGAVDYPALPLGQYLSPAGLSPALNASEGAGVRTLVAAIRDRQRGGCAARPVLLSGYSQGAEVVVRAVTALRPAEREHVAVALFGNPSYRPGRPGDYPGKAKAAGLRPTFQSTAFDLPSDVRRRTLDICAPGDPVCGVDPNQPTIFSKIAWILDHADVHRDAYAFGPAGYAERAAHFLWQYRTR
jgi:hypothetical protein